MGHIDFAKFNRHVIQEEIGAVGLKIGVIDASFLTKSGKHTEGLGMFWNGMLGKASKGLEVSTVGVVDVQSNTAYGLESRLTRDEASEESRTKQYCKQLEDLKEHLKQLNVQHIATDAYYSKQEFTRALRGMDFHQIGKLRRDAYLMWPYQGSYSGRGRPRKYDGIANTKGKLERWQYVTKLDDGTAVFEGIVWSRAIGEIAKVVILRREVNGRTAQALLFSTDISLPAITILEYYKMRFQIEFIFRDAKQHTGLGDCQSRKAVAQNTAANASITALNLLKIENRLEHKTADQTVISIESLKRKKANQQLMNLIFDTLEIDRTEKKVAQVYEELSNFGCIAA